jgi:hypothetical protein
MVGGIQSDAPGYKRIRIQPVIREGLTWAKTSYDSICGKISTDWKLDGSKLTLDVTIPANTTATVFVPAKDASAVTESGKPVTKAEGVKFLRMENGAAVYAVGSGTYRFESTLPSVTLHAENAPPAPAISQERIPQENAAAKPLRILCVGDSITAGYTDNPTWDVPFEFGYRKDSSSVSKNQDTNSSLSGIRRSHGCRPALSSKCIPCPYIEVDWSHSMSSSYSANEICK